MKEGTKVENDIFQRLRQKMGQKSAFTNIHFSTFLTIYKRGNVI